MAQARETTTGTRFVSSAPSVAQLPVLGLPELALAGRSNVGKSSLLNFILGQGKLVRTSRTPGRTRDLNLFVWEDRLAIVDLPGYGYAELPKVERVRLRELMTSYVEERETLSGVALLVDSRREETTEQDRDFAQLVLASVGSLLVVLTKIDLIPKTRRLHQARLIEKSLGVPAGSTLGCSVKSHEGRSELIQRLLELTRPS